jgi:hypothetical protein
MALTLKIATLNIWCRATVTGRLGAILTWLSSATACSQLRPAHELPARQT